LESRVLAPLYQKNIEAGYFSERALKRRWQAQQFTSCLEIKAFEKPKVNLMSISYINRNNLFICKNTIIKRGCLLLNFSYLNTNP
jgi:hypothetical protein